MSLLPLALQAIREGEGSPAYQALSEAAAQGDRPYPYIIAVDFDGTLCENNWPEIGRENWKMLKVLPLLRKPARPLVLPGGGRSGRRRGMVQGAGRRI